MPGDIAKVKDFVKLPLCISQTSRILNVFLQSSIITHICHHTHVISRDPFPAPPCRMVRALMTQE